jgi:hypothetical protein
LFVLSSHPSKLVLRAPSKRRAGRSSSSQIFTTQLAAHQFKRERSHLSSRQTLIRTSLHACLPAVNVCPPTLAGARGEFSERSYPNLLYSVEETSNPFISLCLDSARSLSIKVLVIPFAALSTLFSFDEEHFLHCLREKSRRLKGVFVAKLSTFPPNIFTKNMGCANCF